MFTRLGYQLQNKSHGRWKSSLLLWGPVVLLCRTELMLETTLDQSTLMSSNSLWDAMKSLALLNEK